MTTLAQYDAARAALAEATRIDEILPLLDEFELAKLRAKQIKDQALLADATEFQLRAERRLGQVIEAAKAAGLFKQGRQPKPEKSTGPELSSRPTLEDAGIDKKLSSKAQKRAGIAEQAFELLVQQTRERIASGEAKIISGAPTAHGAGRVKDAKDLDYSPTPPWATRALVDVIMPHLQRRIDGIVREPACGEGHIAEVLRETCSQVIATDIHDGYGYADHIADYLDAEFDVACDWTITNPPFEERVLKFMKRALRSSRIGFAMFLHLRYLEGVNRYNDVFKHHPPTLVAPFVERVPLLMGEYDPDASTTTAFMWLVWIKGCAPQPVFWIPPGQREALTRTDDRERFTAHPVIKKQAPVDSSGHEISHDHDGVVTDDPISDRSDQIESESTLGAEEPAAVHELCSAAAGSPQN